MKRQPAAGGLYLNLIWHQHQPSYLDPQTDGLRGPWVRTHGTKDYYDMAAAVARYPDLHCTFNLTTSLLTQLRHYVDRIGPFVDRSKNRIRARAFLQQWKGKTDPWIDLALRPTASFDRADLDHLLTNPWNALYIADVMLTRFPHYRALKERSARREPLDEQALTEIKFWFFFAYFDPMFLDGAVELHDGQRIDLTDLVRRDGDGTYHLHRRVTEDDCNRIVTEAWKVMANIVPLHRSLQYDPKRKRGQLEITTTPFYHPILPLLYDSDLARTSRPDLPMPARFAYPDDARAQIALSVRSFAEEFGSPPAGMWPAEGSVAHEVVPLFQEEGIRWIATDEQILHRSAPAGLSKYAPYRVGDVAIVFRDTELSDKIGFVYRHWKGADAAADFIGQILRCAPPAGEPDRLVTVILDGENAWEWYENDGSAFLGELYRGIVRAQEEEKLVTVTMSEYIEGNSSRRVAAHPVASMAPLERLYPGSWISASYDTWIGHPQKNRAWEYLRIAREDLGRSGLPSAVTPNRAPQAGTQAWYALKAWESIYAAEGSDWFWWYGTGQQVQGGIRPFDEAFRTHLAHVYRFAREAGASMPDREFPPIDGEPAGIVAGATMRPGTS